VLNVKSEPKNEKYKFVHNRFENRSVPANLEGINLLLKNQHEFAGLRKPEWNQA